MAEDAVDFYEINYDELKSKIRQIESVFDVKVTVSGPTQEVNEECDVSSAKGEIKSSVRIFSSSGNKKLVAEAKEYILSEACQDAAQCRACREGRRRCSGQTDREHKHGDSVTENSEENVRDQSCACVLEYVNRKRSQLNQELSQIIGSKPPMEAGDDGRDALAQCAAAGEEREGDHGDDASTPAAEGGRCEGEEEGEPSPSAGSHLVIPILSPGVDSNHDSCYDSDVSSNGGSRRNSQQHLDTEHSDVSRTASDTLAAEHTPDGFNDKSDLVQDLNNATKTTESVIDDGGKSPDSEEIVLSSGKTDDKLPSEEAESSESAKDGNLMGIPDYAIKVEFGLKLGYSEDQVRAVLAQTGCEVNQNELLSQLIKVGKVGSTSEQDSGDESDVDEEDFCPDSRGGEKRCSNVVTENVVKTPLVPASHTVDESPKPKDASHGTRVEPLDSSSNLRPIVIDGSNVAMSHGNKEVFSCRGIKLAVDWFRLRRHTDIVVFVPQWRKETPRVDTPITDQDILVELEQEKILVFTPARRVGGKRIVCYDDRYIIQLAVENGGIIVSNDNYRDLQSESEEYKRVIEKRLLMYSFVNDRFMPPEDPLGKYGPRLDNFLQKEPTVPDPVPPICPYGKKCTYGNKCKYYHPERGPGHIKSVTEKLAESGGKKIQQVQKHGFYADGKKNQALNKKAPLSKAKSLSPASKQPLSRTKSLQPEMRLGGLSPGPLSTLPGNLTAPNRDDLADKKLQDSPVRVSVTYDAEDSAKYNARLAKLAQRMEDDEKARGLSGRKSKQGHMGSHESLKPPNHWSLVHESLRPVQSDPPSLHYDTSGLGSGHLSLAKKLSDEGSDVGRRSSPRSPAQTEQQLQRDLEQARINAEREQLEHRLQQLVQREKRIEHEQFHDHHHAMYNRPHAQVTGTKSAGMEGMNMHKPLARQLSLQGSEDPRIHAGPPPNYAQQPSIPGVRFHGNPAPKSIIIGERGPPPQWTEQYMESPGPRFSHRPPLTRVGSVTDMGRRPMHNPVQRIPSAPVTQHSQVTSSAPSMTRQNSTSDPQLNLVSEDFVGALQGAAQYPGGPADSRSIWAQKFNQMHPHLTHQNLSPSASGPTPGVKVAFGGPGVRPMAQYDQFHPSLGHTCSNPLDAHMSTPPPSLHGSSQNLMQGYPGASQSPHSFAHHSSNPSLSSVSQNFSPYSQEMQAMLLSQYGSGLGHSKAAPTHFFPPSPFDAIQTSIASNNLFSPQQISAEPHAHMSSPDPHSRPSSSQSMDSLSSSLQMSNRPVQYHGGLPLGGQSSASPGGGGGSGGIDPCQEPPLLLADPKHQHIFAHLCALFPKDDVQKVVYQFPHETNPKELCQHIMRRINNK